MAAIPVATLESYIWDTILDVDSANRAFDETTLLRILNRNYCMLKGITDDRVYDLSASVAGTSYATGAKLVTTSVAYIRRILEMYPTSGSGSAVPGGKALARVEPWEFFRVHSEDALTLDDVASTASTVFTCYRLGTATAADVGKWAVGVWRSSGTSTRTYMLRVIKEPTALTNADTPDLDDAGCYALGDMTAAIGARLIGRTEEEIAEIKSRVPEGLQGVLGRVETELGLTKPRPQEMPA